MGHALSVDLRFRLLAAVDGGLSCRAAAARFGVAPSTAIRWQAQQRETGSVASKPQGGDMRSRARVDVRRRVERSAGWRCHAVSVGEPLRNCLSEVRRLGISKHPAGVMPGEQPVICGLLVTQPDAEGRASHVKGPGDLVGGHLAVLKQPERASWR